MHHEFITPLQASYPYSKLSTTYNDFKSFIEDSYLRPGVDGRREPDDFLRAPAEILRGFRAGA